MLVARTACIHLLLFLLNHTVDSVSPNYFSAYIKDPCAEEFQQLREEAMKNIPDGATFTVHFETLMAQMVELIKYNSFLY